MEYSNAWLRFRKAEKEYFDSQHDFMQDNAEMISDLTKAVATVDDRATALVLLAKMEPEQIIIAPMLSEIMWAAIDSSNLTTIELARDVLCRYKNEPWVRSNIPTAIAAYLVEDNDMDDEWHYRRTAELYKLLSYKEEFISFVALCQASNSSVIQELAEEFIAYKI